MVKVKIVTFQSTFTPPLLYLFKKHVLGDSVVKLKIETQVVIENWSNPKKKSKFGKASLET